MIICYHTVRSARIFPQLGKGNASSAKSVTRLESFFFFFSFTEGLSSFAERPFRILDGLLSLLDGENMTNAERS